MSCRSIHAAPDPMHHPPFAFLLPLAGRPGPFNPNQALPVRPVQLQPVGAHHLAQRQGG